MMLSIVVALSFGATIFVLGHKSSSIRLDNSDQKSQKLHAIKGIFICYCFAPLSLIVGVGILASLCLNWRGWFDFFPYGMAGIALVVNAFVLHKLAMGFRRKIVILVGQKPT
jgi:hypothetical protein